MSDWWADSTAESYLDSTLSRRRFWHISITTMSVVVLTGDWATNAIAYVCVDAVILITVVLVTNLLPRQHLKADLVMSSAGVLCALWGFLLIRNGHPYMQASDTLDSQMAWAWAVDVSFVVTMNMGMHSIATVAALLVLMLISTTLAPSAFLPFATGACLVATVGIMLESLLAAAHKYHAALKTVLDDCTDGIVRISVSTGIIGKASGKMQDTWFEATSAGANGVDFKDCLHPNDAGQWEALLAEARTKVPGARLVTCQKVLQDSVVTVDCKLVPYMKRRDELWICCHIVGEARTASAPGAPAFGAGQGHLAPVEEEAGQGPSSVVVRREDGEAGEDPSSVVGPRGQAAADAMAPQRASSLPLQPRIAAPSVRAGSELTYSISDISAPNPKVKLDASTQTLSSFSQARTRPPRLPRTPAQPLASGRASSSSETRLQGRQLHVNRSKRKVLPHYEETPRSTLEQIMLLACRSINARGRGCCSWHITIGRLQTVLRKMRAGACDGFPYGDWQCAHCFALNMFSMNAYDVEECTICGAIPDDTDSDESGGDEDASLLPERAGAITQGSSSAPTRLLL